MWPRAAEARNLFTSPWDGACVGVALAILGPVSRCQLHLELALACASDSLASASVIAINFITTRPQWQCIFFCRGLALLLRIFYYCTSTTSFYFERTRVEPEWASYD